MKIPVFEEIQLNQACDSAYIEEKFTELHVGEIPVYIRADKITREDFIETLPNIERAIKRMGVNPKLPYPIVILTSHIEEHHSFAIVKTEEDLLKHFNTQTKRLSKKELQILNKISLAKDKFINLFSEDSIADLQNVVKNQRELYTLSKELFFYETLKKKSLKTQEKRNEPKKR